MSTAFRLAGMALVLVVAAVWVLVLAVYAVGYGLAYAIAGVFRGPALPSIPPVARIPRQRRP